MNTIDKENVKIPNSVIVSGLTSTDLDEEIADFLKAYGSISRVIKVTDLDPEFSGQVIVEYEHGLAIQALDPDLPCHRTSSIDPCITYHLRTLTSVYASKIGDNTTRSYLRELQGIAKLSGLSFEDVLQKELARMQGSIGASTDSSEEAAVHSPSPKPDDLLLAVPPSVGPRAGLTAVPILRDPLIDVTHTPLKLGDVANRPISLNSDQMNPPEVQRLVVEHIVKSGEVTSQFPAPTKLRTFSGKCPRPNHEVDYDTWRNNVVLLLKDPTVSDVHRARRILESLLPPAIEIVKPLGAEATPRAYLDLLDSAFGTVEDGDELFAKFLNTHQNVGEKPSDYLHRLQTILNAAVKRGGIVPGESNRQLLKQFCRGCWDNSFIVNLQLEQKKNAPPLFSELLLLLRTEEDRQAAKVSRMKQHLGLSRTKTISNPQSVYASYLNEHDVTDHGPEVFPMGTEELRKQIADLQKQLTSLKAANDESCKKASHKASQPKVNKHQEMVAAGSHAQSAVADGKPRPWYCFKCGKDGHIARTCSDVPNALLVEMKKKELREKQRSWEAQHSFSNSPHLN